MKKFAYEIASPGRNMLYAVTMLFSFSFALVGAVSLFSDVLKATHPPEHAWLFIGQLLAAFVFFQTSKSALRPIPPEQAIEQFVAKILEVTLRGGLTHLEFSFHLPKEFNTPHTQARIEALTKNAIIAHAPNVTKDNAESIVERAIAPLIHELDIPVQVVLTGFETPKPPQRRPGDFDFENTP